MNWLMARKDEEEEESVALYEPNEGDMDDKEGVGAPFREQINNEEI